MIQDGVQQKYGESLRSGTVKMATDQENALTNLEDDTVKLVAYTIVSLKRDDERIMDGGQASVIVKERMTGTAFIGWILAKYLQQQVESPEDKTKKVPR